MVQVSEGPSPPIFHQTKDLKVNLKNISTLLAQEVNAVKACLEAHASYNLRLLEGEVSQAVIKFSAVFASWDFPISA